MGSGAPARKKSGGEIAEEIVLGILTAGTYPIVKELKQRSAESDAKKKVQENVDLVHQEEKRPPPAPTSHDPIVQRSMELERRRLKGKQGLSSAFSSPRGTAKPYQSLLDTPPGAAGKTLLGE